MSTRRPQTRCHICERRAHTRDVGTERITRATVRGFVPTRVGALKRVARTVDFKPSPRAVWRFLVHRNNQTQWRACASCHGEMCAFEDSLDIMMRCAGAA